MILNKGLKTQIEKRPAKSEIANIVGFDIFRV